MFTDRARGVANTTLVAELLLVSLAYWVWVVIWESVVGVSLADLDRYLVCNEFLLLGLLLGSRAPRIRASGALGRYERSEAGRSARRKTIAALFSVFGVMVALRDSSISREFLFSFGGVLYLVLRWSGRALPRWAARACFQGSRPERVLVVGCPDKARRLADWLQDKASLGLHAVGLLYDPPVGSEVRVAGGRVAVLDVPAAHAAGSPAQARPEESGRRETVGAGGDVVGALAGGLPWLGRLAEFEAVLDRQEIHQVLLLGLSWPDGFLRECVARCEERGMRLMVSSDLEEQFRHTVTLFEDQGVQLIGLREEPLEDPINRWCKRLLDLMVSAPITLLLLPPVTALVWVVLRWQSPGPVFFRQLRSGFQGRQFIMFKFRTMHTQNDDETRQVRRGDPRVFPVGRWMRTFSLDELPQFYNVLRGNMSVVGPRPHIPAHDELFARAMRNYRVRAAVKPGLTGLAQVRGFRGGTFSDEDVTRRVSADIEYLERWTLELDLWIMARTVCQLLVPPRTAY
jgi:putative colanic acid biosynthesis UDP-glucose lipid carrier transferase